MSADILAVIGQYGFPIAVTVYLLYERAKRDNQASDRFIKVVENNTLMLGGISETIKRCEK